MYKILIVDDEELICQSIVSMINRSGISNIKDVTYSTSAYEAERIILQSMPDIVITDICMPGLSGLDLIRNTSTTNITTKYIIFSGYNEFEYAKSAIKLNVIDYLLKPVSMANLKESLSSAVNLLNKEKLYHNLQDEQNQRVNNKQIHDNLEITLNMLLQNTDKQEGKISETIKYLRSVIPYKYLCIAVIDAYKSMLSKNHDTLIQIRKFNSESIEGHKNLYTYEFINFENNIIIIYNTTNEDMYYKIVEHNHLLFNIIFKNNDVCKFVCGISEISDNFYDISNLYTYALQALSYKLIMNHLSVIEYLTIKEYKKKYSIPFNQVNEFVEDIKNYKLDRITCFIDSNFSKESLTGYSIDAIEMLYKSMLNIIWIIFIENDLRDYANVLMTSKSIYSFSDIRDVRLYLKELILKSIQHLESSKQVKTPVEIAKEYIKKNIGKKDISMAVVSNEVNMNYTYFSMLFKQETGMNFSEYLTTEKMKEAQKLMSDSSNKIQDIAVKLGYENPRNFTRAYKKFFGISPSKYKFN